MCERAIEEGPYALEHVPDHAKTQGMCNKAVRHGPFSLRFVSDWFVTQGQIKLWLDDDYYHDDDRIIKW